MNFEGMLAMDKDAGSYLESDESLASDDDPLRDIKAAWVMSGEKEEDFSILKFNKKLRLQEKQDFALNFIKGTCDYEEKIDVLEGLKRRQMRAKKVAETSLWLGKTVGKEVLTLGRNAASVVEPRFMRRARRRNDHLKRIDDHEKRAVKINEERLKIEADRVAMAFKRQTQQRQRGLLLDQMKPTEDLKMALDKVAATRKRELDLMASVPPRRRRVAPSRDDERPPPFYRFRARRARDVTERLQKEQDRQDAKEKEENDVNRARREWRTTHYTQLAADARAEAKSRRRAGDGRVSGRDAQLAACRAEHDTFGIRSTIVNGPENNDRSLPDVSRSWKQRRAEPKRPRCERDAGLRRYIAVPRLSGRFPRRPRGSPRRRSTGRRRAPSSRSRAPR